MDSYLHDVIDEVITTSLKDTRQNVFDSWANALIQKDWEGCDTCVSLLLHTLSDNSESRKTLEGWMNLMKDKYDSEVKLLQDTISAQSNPFQREQLKEKKIELDQWRASEIHDKFFETFKVNSLIDAT